MRERTSISIRSRRYCKAPAPSECFAFSPMPQAEDRHRRREPLVFYASSLTLYFYPLLLLSFYYITSHRSLTRCSKKRATTTAKPCLACRRTAEALRSKSIMRTVTFVTMSIRPKAIRSGKKTPRASKSRGSRPLF
jgi:hypothetical protein